MVLEEIIDFGVDHLLSIKCVSLPERIFDQCTVLTHPESISLRAYLFSFC